MQLRIDASEIGDLAALWQKAPELMREELAPAVETSLMLVRAELVERLPGGYGIRQGEGLAGTLTTQVDAEGSRVEGAVGSPMPYAEYVELGTRPRGTPPPVEPIQMWVEAKLGLGGAEAKSAAIAIGRAIAKRGTKANPVWEQTANDVGVQQQVLAHIADGVVRVTQRMGTT